MDNIESVISSLIQGMVISMVVLFLFLGEPKSSMIIALAMPLSVFAALVMMSIYGMTINMMSLGGLVVGIGMMVDNSIVVMESCFKVRGTGRSFMESAEEAARIAEEIEEKEQSIFNLVSQGMALKDARSQVGYHHLQTRE